MPKIGFMFGAGAEVSYGLPTGGDFALNIFRHDSADSKNIFKKQRDSIDRTGRYAQWLPDDFENKNISVFRKKAFEEIIRCTVEQNRENIIRQLNDLDTLAEGIVTEMQINDGIDICNDFKITNGSAVSDSFMNKNITFVHEFEDGDDLFMSNYFSALLMAYKNFKKDVKERTELGRIIISILQLQIGALGEKLTHRLNEGIFDKKDDELDILDDLGDIILLNYQSVGMSGLEYLLEIQQPDLARVEGRILRFAQILIEKVYSSVLDYKSLIDSNWMYLYHPITEWGKFCKISIFLLNVQKYIKDIFDKLPAGKKGYYDDVFDAVTKEKMEITAVATSNYSPLIANILNMDDIIYLNGSTSLWYDPYLNRIGTMSELASLQHFLVPLMFTQSGTKPMISIEMSSKYVDYYESLKDSDEICVVGFGFNSDDEHINGIFRDLVDCKKKHITIVTPQSGKSIDTIKKLIVGKLKLQDDSNISIILVDKERMMNNVSWVDCLLASIES